MGGGGLQGDGLLGQGRRILARLWGPGLRGREEEEDLELGTWVGEGCCRKAGASAGGGPWKGSEPHTPSVAEAAQPT